MKISIHMTLVILILGMFIALSPAFAASDKKDQVEPEIDVEQVKQSADKGNAAAQYLMGYWHEMGKQGFSPDLVKARQWYEKAESGGNLYARDRLAVMVYNGLAGAEQDVSKAVSLFEKSADEGSAAAQYMLGRIYFDGGTKGVEQDVEKGVKLIRKSAENGNPQAQDFLGVLYYNGNGGLKEDKSEAFKWYQKAADGGDEGGLIHLGSMYYYGIAGVEKDRDRAVALLEKAFKQGSERAYQILAMWSGNKVQEKTVELEMKKGEGKPPGMK